MRLRCVLRNVCARIGSVVAPFRESGQGRTALALVILASCGFAGCAQQPPQIAATAGHSKEYFPSAVYGTASRRVVENGPVPHGGGQYLVGRPYTVAGHTYYPSERKLVQVGNASWYGDAFHGRLTANGEIYDRDSFTAAHPTMPLPSYARVTNLRTQASMIVRVNDRGPFAANRVMDVSRGVAEALDFRQSGTARVKVEYVGRASLAGSDDQKLYATLRKNGPAEWREGDPAMLAEARPAPRVASIEMPRVASVEPRPAVIAPVAPVVLEVAPQPRRFTARPLEAEPMREAPPPRIFARTEPVPVERHAARTMDAAPVWRRGPDPIAMAARSPARHASDRASRAIAEPVPLARPGHDAVASLLAHEPLPPSRAIDLRAGPGAGGPIHALHRPNGSHLLRSRDDD